MTRDIVLKIDQLTKKYGDFTALDRLSLTLERGRILGFVGPNGAGKTTTIRILVGQARPTSGSASIAGIDCVKDARQTKRLVGYMPDVFGSYDNMRVREYLDFFGAAFGVPRAIRGRRIDEVLDISGSAYMKDRFVESLSHGMKQRVAIARTLLHDPEMLILDEPANGLDPQARIELRTILLRLAEMGKTLLVTSHILPELSQICDCVAIITHGRLQAFGSLPEIMRQLCQKRIFEVQLISKEKLDRSAQLIRELVGPEAEVTTSAAEAIVRFTTTQSEQELSHMLTQLAKAELGVSQFRELQTSLEDAFLTVIQREASASEKPSRKRVPGVRSARRKE